MNKVILVGRLTADPELKMTPTGVNTVRFTIATPRKFKNAEGGYDADFPTCIAWREKAEFICKYFNKGSMIGLLGSLQTRSWEKDGEKRYATEVNVEDVEFVESKKQASDNVQPSVQNSFPLPETSVEADGDLPF